MAGPPETLPRDMLPGSRTYDRDRGLFRPSISFLDAIRPDLREKGLLTPEKPWAYFTMEEYGRDVQGQGGLGILAEDIRRLASKLQIPMVFVTPFYRREAHQKIRRFNQQIVPESVSPEEKGFRHTADVEISTRTHRSVPLKVYTKQEGTVTTVTISERNFGELYQGESASDHRLYQEAALGFGGHKAIKKLGFAPSIYQLNEAPTIFAALARLNEQIEVTGNFDTALAEVRANTIYTNHTLVQAVEASFTLEQFEEFIMPNIKSENIKGWLRSMFERNGGSLKLSTLAIELSGKKNGVSLIHAKEASKTYKDIEGNPVSFEGVTNGIELERWQDPALLDLYRTVGVLDEYYLPGENFAEKIQAIDNARIREIKNRARARLRDYLRARKDQYGCSVEIPDGAKILNWKKRMVSYKRPGLPFTNPQEFARILESENIHFIITGKAHRNDTGMQIELQEILEKIDKTETLIAGNVRKILKERVHYIQDYDEDLARALAQGADMSINTPLVYDEFGNRKSTEACGTSWEKDVANNTILISTDDGGVADLTVMAELRGEIDRFRPPYLQVTGVKPQDEAVSLLRQIQRASAIIDGRDGEISYYDFVKRQFAAYLPIISGARMMQQYIDLVFPRDDEDKAA